MAEEKKPYQVLYDYSDAPTLRKFALDNTRIRNVIGPFGSGKSSAMVMEIIRRGHEQVPGPDGIRRTRWAVVRNCYDDQTEILTEKRGWQLFKNVLSDDKAATLVEDHLVFQNHDGLLEYPYQGEMTGFEGESVDFLVTPEHKMWVSTRRTRAKIWSEYEIRTAEEIYGSELVRVRKDAKWAGTPPEESTDFFEFLGFWFAEGSCGEYQRKDTAYTARRLNITQKKHTGYVESLLLKNDLFYRKNEKSGTGCFTYSLEGNHAFMEKYFNVFRDSGTQTVRKVPQFIKDAPPNHLKAFIYGFFMGDGGNSGGTTRLYTSSKILADDLQEIALKAGMVANIGTSDTTGTEVCINGKMGVVNAPFHRVTLLKEKRYRPVLRLNPNHTNHLKGWYKKEYDGMVYCLNMPDIPVFVRRNGNAFWCLRSYLQLKDTTIKTFHDWFPPSVFGEYRVTDHSYFITKFSGVYIEVMFRALDRPDQVSNLLSLELTGAWFNEAREIPEAIIVAMDGRINRYPSRRDGGATWAGIIMDSNPPEEGSYIYRMNEIIKPDNWKGFKQPSGLSAHAENTKHLAKNYYRDLAKGKDDMYVRVYIHGQYGFTITGKPVFQSFVDSVHVARQALEPQKGLDLLIGFDFALQPTCVIGQVTPLGQLRIIDELVSDGMGLKQFCDNILLPRLRTKYFGYSVMGFGDPSGISRAPTDESTCFDVLHSPEVGLSNIEPAPTNLLVPRISAVEAFLNKMWKGEPGFLLSPTCTGLRKAMNGAYHYEKEPKAHGGDEYKAMPAKNYASHVADATEYLCLYISEKEESDKRHRSFMAQFKKMEYRPGDGITGY